MAETDLTTLLRTMKPRLHGGTFVFCSVAPEHLDELALTPVGLFYEDEGVTLMLSKAQADRANLPYQMLFRMVTLGVYSDLGAVGFLAAVTGRLAAHGISVNPVSGYYHDHLFVPAERAEEVMRLLVGLEQE